MYVTVNGTDKLKALLAAIKCHTHTQFLFCRPIFPKLVHIRLLQVRLGIVVAELLLLDALPVTQPAASDH